MPNVIQSKSIMAISGNTLRKESLLLHFVKTNFVKRKFKDINLRQIDNIPRGNREKISKIAKKFTAERL